MRMSPTDAIHSTGAEHTSKRGRTHRFTTMAGTTFATLAVLSLTAAPAFAANKAVPAENGGLVALGDSITFGYNLSGTHNNTTADAEAYPYWVANAYHMPVSDLGVPDWTSADLLQALTTPNFQRAVAHARVVVVDIGNNDLLGLASQMGILAAAEKDPTAAITLTATQSAQFSAAIAQLGVNLAKIVTVLRTFTHAPVVLVNEYNPFPAGTGLNTLATQLIGGANQQISGVGTKLGVPVADAYAAFNGNQSSYVLPGDVHPTVAGQEALAQAVEAVLKQPAVAAQMPPGASATSAAADVTSIAVAKPAPGSTQTVLLGAGSLTWSIPANAYSTPLELAATTANAASLAGLVTAKQTLDAEFGVNFEVAGQPHQPVTLTYQNRAIEANASVEELVNGSLVADTAAKVTSGQVVVSTSAAADFVIVSPPKVQPSVVRNATSPVTGLPFARDEAMGGILLLGGAALIAAGRRRRRG